MTLVIDTKGRGGERKDLCFYVNQGMTKFYIFLGFLLFQKIRGFLLFGKPSESLQNRFKYFGVYAGIGQGGYNAIQSDCDSFLRLLQVDTLRLCAPRMWIHYFSPIILRRYIDKIILRNYIPISIYHGYTPYKLIKKKQLLRNLFNILRIYIYIYIKYYILFNNTILLFCQQIPFGRKDFLFIYKQIPYLLTNS